MLAAVTGAAALTGCGQLINPYTTELQYDAADGVSASVGDLKAVDLLVVTDEKGSSNEMSGLVHNSADADRQLTISVGGTDKKVTVPAGQSIRLDGKANGNSPATVDAVSLPSLGQAKAGDQIEVSLATSPGGSTTVAVPVLLDQPPYGTTKVEHAEDAEPEGEHDAGINESTAPPSAEVEHGTSVSSEE